MKKLGAGLVVAVALLLGGCASTPAAEEPAAGNQQAAETAPDLTGTPTPTPGTWLAEEMTPEQTVLLIMQKAWQGPGLPSDEEILAAATGACEQLRAGADRDSVSMFPGTTEEMGRNNNLLRVNAASYMCPEVNS